MARSLNKVILIGNLTRDPELRYTPNGTAVCNIGLATNRQWVTESGEKKEDVEFHNLLAWTKLAEICANLLKKGRKIYVEGRLQTSDWQAQDGSKRTKTEVVISDMIILDPKGAEGPSDEFNVPVDAEAPTTDSQEAPVKDAKKGKKKKEEVSDEINEEEIPF